MGLRFAILDWHNLNIAGTSNIQHPTSNIYLTGFMACGKSTVGPLLARRLGYVFVDLDDEIEARVGKTIPALFEEVGEAGFRRREAEALRATAARERVVVALGGGALADEKNLRWVLRNGFVVYLEVSSGELARRLRSTGGERPMLLDETGAPLSEATLHGRIEALLAQRRSFYEQAHIVVAADRWPEEVVAATVRALQAAGVE